jgi:hypothetical protein
MHRTLRKYLRTVRKWVLTFRILHLTIFIRKFAYSKKTMAGIGILIGTVTDSTDSGAIEEATVTLVEINLTVTTDEDGYYYFESVPAGIYTLKVKAATYLEETVTDVEILPNSEVTEDVALNSDVEGRV